MRFSKAAAKSRSVRIDQSHTLLKVRSKHRKGAPGLKLGMMARVGNVFRKRGRIKALAGDDALLSNALKIKTTARKQARTTDHETDRLLANRFGRKEKKRLEKQPLAPKGVSLSNRVE